MIGTMRRVGVHISIAGGIDKGLERAHAIGCSTVQMFSHNPRGWKLGKRSADEIKRFGQLKTSLNISPVFIHTSYLINLASGDADLRRKSIDMVAHEMTIADTFGAEYVVLHTGSASSDNPKTARRRAARALSEVGEQGRWRAGLLLENTAGERGDITSRVRELAEIMEEVGGSLIAGICIDTCHAYSAGYDIGSPAGIRELSEEVLSHIGRDRLKLIHLNDSKGGLHAGVDRHEHIGKGRIGSTGIKTFLNSPAFFDVPVILETPKKEDDDDRRNLDIVRSFIKA